MKRLVIILTALAFTACVGGSGGSNDTDTSVQDTGNNQGDGTAADTAADTAAPSDTPASQDSTVVDDTTTLDFNAPPQDAGNPDVTRVQPGANALGQICNAETQCPMGYTCLSTAEGAPGFCSRPCTPGPNTDDCVAGYSGVGIPNCFMGLQGQDGSVQGYCGIVCKANEMPNLTGECPAGMECTAALQDQDGNEIATGCVVAQ